MRWVDGMFNDLVKEQLVVFGPGMKKRVVDYQIPESNPEQREKIRGRHILAEAKSGAHAVNIRLYTGQRLPLLDHHLRKMEAN